MALWVFALALLLKAAVPLLATAAAQVQGKTLVEVCTVYGIKTVALDASEAAEHQAPAEHAAHSAEHCALGGLVAGGMLDAPPAPGGPAFSAFTSRPIAARAAPPAPDACARWVAQLKHGPPSFA